MPKGEMSKGSGVLSPGEVRVGLLRGGLGKGESSRGGEGFRVLRREMGRFPLSILKFGLWRRGERWVS